MTSLITSNTTRLGRASVALILAVAALVWLLSTWGSLPTAEARGPAEANTDSTNLLLSSRSILTSWVFLPILFKSDVVFYDDFSNTSSGWPHNTSYEKCYFKYLNGRYRVEITQNGQSCVIPNFQIPRQFYGTFKIKVRRVSDANSLFYGFIFDAGLDATDETGTRWSLEVYPKDADACDDEPFFWLIGMDEGDVEFRNYNESPDDHECISFIKTGRNEWNELAVVRKNRNIKVYIKNSGGVYQLVGNYDNVPTLETGEQDKHGYFNLRVLSSSSGTVVVEYDDLEITPSTSAP